MWGFNAMTIRISGDRPVPTPGAAAPAPSTKPRPARTAEAKPQPATPPPALPARTGLTPAQTALFAEEDAIALEPKKLARASDAVKQDTAFLLELLGVGKNWDDKTLKTVVMAMG